MAKAIPAVQCGCGRASRTATVMAVTTVRKVPPTRAPLTYARAGSVLHAGIAVPSASTPITSAMPRPPGSRPSTRPHTSPLAAAATPTTAQNVATCGVLNPRSVSSAMTNVR